MKKHIITILTFLLLGFLSISITYAQAPDKFIYQAQAVDDKGIPFRNATLAVKISILEGSDAGIIVWEGNHMVTTDNYGLFTLVIGDGTGGNYNFTDIDWAGDDHFLNVQIDDGKKWVDMGTTQFLSVPYALHANTVDLINVDTPVDNQILKYNSGTGKWENWTPDFLITEIDGDVTNEIQNLSQVLLIGNLANSQIKDVTDPTDLQDAATKGYVDVSAAGGWRISGNPGTSPANDFIGTTDDNPLVFRVNNTERLRLNTSGNLSFHGIGGSVFIGDGAGVNDDLSDNQNTFIGNEAGNSNTTGNYNTANGYQALNSNSTGFRNTANGSFALSSNTTASYNTANGFRALYLNITGSYNTAHGNSALYDNTSGGSNTAIGYSALYANSSGSSNTASGVYALVKNTTADMNTATGFRALFNNTTGPSNTATGNRALYNNTTGNSNTATGSGALNQNTTGSGNTVVGYYAGPTVGTLYNAGAFGNRAKVTTNNTIRIGDNNITQIGGAVGWSNLSDGRFKINVQADVPGLDFIMELRPVVFKWDLEALEQFQGITEDEEMLENPEEEIAKIEKGKKVYTGLIGQEVEEAANAINYDFSGIIKPADEKSSYNLNYAEFVMPLIKAIQEQQQMIEELQQEVENLSNE